MLRERIVPRWWACGFVRCGSPWGLVVAELSSLSWYQPGVAASVWLRVPCRGMIRVELRPGDFWAWQAGRWARVV